MKKKKILIPIICFTAVIILSLVTFLIVASNYKKTYVLNTKDYFVSLVPEGYYGLDVKVNNYYLEKRNEYINGKDFSVNQKISVFVYDETHTTEKKVLKCTKSKYVKGNSSTEHNAIIYLYGYHNHEIPKKGHYEFVEYPLWKSKNYLYVVYTYEK